MIDDTGTEAGDVVVTVRIAAPPEAVFDHLIQPEKLMAWMGVDAEIEPRPGGLFRLNVTGKDIAVGSYVAVDPPRNVSFTWGWEHSSDVPPGSSLVAIDLSPEGDETVVTLTHSGLPGGSGDEHSKGWVHYLDRLIVVVGGGDPGADPHTLAT